MKEMLILVSPEDEVVGSASKKEAHDLKNLKKEGAVPHRAFSVFLFNSKNELYLQKRSKEKITFPGLWTNTCCSHPLMNPEEMVTKRFEGIKTAANRRMEYELGLSGLRHENYSMISKILYQADSCNVWGEYELDYILFAKPEND